MKELGEVVPGEDSAPKPVSSNPVASGTAVPPPASLVCSFCYTELMIAVSNRLFSNSEFDQPNQILAGQIYYTLLIEKPMIDYGSETNVYLTFNPIISTRAVTWTTYL